MSKEPPSAQRGEGERRREGRGEGRRTYQELFTSIACGPSSTDTPMNCKHAAVHAGGVVVDSNRGRGGAEGEEHAAVGQGGGGSFGNRSGGGEREGRREGGKEGGKQD